MKVITFFAIASLSACGATLNEDVLEYGKYREYDQRVSQPGEVACLRISDSDLRVALSSVNASRLSRGLAPLSSNSKMSSIANKQACHMARTGLMSHAGPRNEGPKHRAQAEGYKPVIIAENIAAGPYDLNAVLKEWSSSPAHLANILIPQVRDFGIGQSVSADGNRYWVAVYAARQ